MAEPAQLLQGQASDRSARADGFGVDVLGEQPSEFRRLIDSYSDIERKRSLFFPSP
jgi:hypothetical protein